MEEKERPTRKMGETEVMKLLETLREISETFRKRKWNPIPCGPREFIIEFPNENALNHLLS